MCARILFSRGWGKKTLFALKTPKTYCFSQESKTYYFGPVLPPPSLPDAHEYRSVVSDLIFPYATFAKK